MILLRAISGFRLVSRDSHWLARFYQAIGFILGTAGPIDAAEMSLLGLAGAGTRLPLTLGPSLVELDSCERAGHPYPADMTAMDSKFQHLALVTTDIAAAWARAIAAGATAIGRDGPVVLPAASGGVIAVKFRDPEGHPLEFLQFPGGTNAAWTGTGVLGIDHSAIPVADVERSIAFYTAHGLTQSNRTLNEDLAQVTLDGIGGQCGAADAGAHTSACRIARLSRVSPADPRSADARRHRGHADRVSRGLRRAAARWRRPPAPASQGTQSLERRNGSAVIAHRDSFA